MIALYLCGFVDTARAQAEPPALPDAPPRALAEEARRAASQSAFSVQFERLLGAPGGLTADRVATLAASSSWSVRAKAAGEEDMQAKVDQSSTAFLPYVRVIGSAALLSSIRQDPLGPGNLLGTTAPTGPLAPGAPVQVVSSPTVPAYRHQYFLQASLIVPLSDYVFRYFAQRRSALRALDAAAFARQATELSVRASARELYYRWVLAKLQTLVASQAFEQAVQHQRDVAQAQGAGTLSQSDVLEVDARVLDSELFEQTARDNEGVLALQLRTAMHDDSGHSYQIGDDLEPRVTSAESMDVEGHYRVAVTRRPELLALVAQRQQHEEQARATHAEYAPKLEAFGNYYYANPNPRYVPQRNEFDGTWDVGARVTWSPNDLLSGRTQMDRERAQIAECAAEERALRDLIRSEVMVAHQRAARSSLAIRSSEQTLESAEETYRVRRERFRSGRATSSDLTEAEVKLTQARLNAVAARIERRLAAVALAHAAGLDAVSTNRR